MPTPAIEGARNGLSGGPAALRVTAVPWCVWPHHTWFHSSTDRATTSFVQSKSAYSRSSDILVPTLGFGIVRKCLLSFAVFYSGNDNFLRRIQHTECPLVGYQSENVHDLLRLGVLHGASFLKNAARHPISVRLMLLYKTFSSSSGISPGR